MLCQTDKELELLEETLTDEKKRKSKYRLERDEYKEEYDNLKERYRHLKKKMKTHKNVTCTIT